MVIERQFLVELGQMTHFPCHPGVRLR